MNAVAEPTWHDNSVADSDSSAPEPGESDYEERKGLPVTEAAGWAQGLPFPVTLYLYDDGDGLADR